MKNVWKFAIAAVFLHAYAASTTEVNDNGNQINLKLYRSEEQPGVPGDFTRYPGISYRAGRTRHSTKSVPHRKTKRRENYIYETNMIDASLIRNKRDLGTSNIMITHHFNDKVLTPGEDVSLQCSASGDRPPRFVWERDGVVISSNTDPRYTLGQMMSASGVGVVSHLNISRSRVEDGGLYSCIAVEGEQSTRHMARIDVYGPPYIRTLPPIKVQSGEPLKLRCPYYGYPISKLEWEHRGKKIISTTLQQHLRYKRYLRRKRQLYTPEGDGVLHISAVDKVTTDTYTCVVYTSNGEMARRSFEIQVVEAPELDELRVGTGLKEGQIVQITCNIISGDPPIYFSWLKDGKKMPSSLKITERSSDLFSVLIIKRVSLEHCGKYTCIATNHVGKVNQTADLYINVAPKWMEEPQNASLLLGQRGVVYCNANGYPSPQIHWMKKDTALGIWRPVLDLAGGGVMSLSNGTLLIEVVSLSDEGIYACHADNGVGDALTANVWIAVNKPVHFETMSVNLTTKAGLSVELPCRPRGDNPIRLKWTHEGKLIDFASSRITISETPSHNGVNSVIHISYVKTRDGGSYECRASNPYGVAAFNVHLNILEPPTPPHDLQIESITSNSARVTWRDSGVHSQYYTVQYTSNDYQMWEAPAAVNVTRRMNEIHQTGELRDLQPSTEYRVRVSAGNQVALSAYTQPARFTTQEEAPSSPPVNVQVEQTADAGSLSVRWSSSPGGTAVRGYRVRATPARDVAPGPNDTQIKTVKVSSRAGKQETVLTGLLKNTRYAVSVSAFNSAGDGPFSLPVYQTTREGAPEQPPSAVECRGVSSTSLRVSWQPIDSHGTSLLGYSVYYATDDGPQQNISSPHTEIYLQALLKYTNYTIKVAGFSNYGMGPFSYPIVCPTLQDVPGPPSAIKVVVSSATSLIVSWKRPNQPNGEVTHYTLYVKPVSSSSVPQSYRVEATDSRQLTFPLTGLTGRQYEVSVAAHTTAGEGATCSANTATLTDRVVAGISSLGGPVSVAVGSSLLLVCECVGIPSPRTVWYHKHNIITHHPRFTRNHDDSLLINNIDQSLSGNYTCLAKNLYGSDSVSYTVSVLATPAPPALAATPSKHSIHLQWEPPTQNNKKISYNLTWKESTGSWQDTWNNKESTVHGVQEYTLQGLKCGTKYSVRMTAVNAVGPSAPAYIDIATLGGVPIAPSTTEWLWSNATHIYIQLSGWDDNGCELTSVEVDYREYGTKTWKKADNKFTQSAHQWPPYPSGPPSSFAVGPLTPAQWYQLRVTVSNSAGQDITTFNIATTTTLGESIGPPSDFFDINMVVIICSSVLLMLCSLTCVYILVKRHNHQHLTEYRNSLTTECKSERSNNTANTPQGAPQDITSRVYSTPVHLTHDAKHELYEISPYAQFALGFRTFGHQDNQEAPTRLHLPGNSTSRYDTETSFQMRSESEESDCMSRTTTLKSAPKKACRIPHHR